ncbi:ABC transporter permease [Kitasatospora sp. NPDC098663]|uniref:ABC transporter permease n=1 Tax=Kitasatospora sp. NPDC098663 TaxID=3364096 RepID=UPI00382E6885
MRIYWMEIRRSPLRWWLPVLLALDFAAIFGRSQWWIGVWPQASVAAQLPSLYFGPALAASATWTAGRARRAGITEQLGASARPAWQLELAQLAATLSYGTLVYLVGAVSAAVVSISDAGSGFLWPGYLLLGFGVMVGCAGLGHLVGRWSASPYAASAVCGLGCFLFLAWIGKPSALDLLMLSGDPFVKVAVSPLLVRLALGCGLAAIAVLVARPGARLRGRVGWRATATRRFASLGAVAVFVLAAVAVGPAGPIRIQRAAAEPLCSETAPRVCLWPEDRKYLPEVTAMAGRMSKLPTGMFTVPGDYYEQGLRSGQVNDFYILEGSLWDPAISMGSAIVQHEVPPLCPKVDTKLVEQIGLASGELSMWLAVRIYGGGRPASMHGGPPNVDMEAVARLATQPEETQIAWVQQRLQTLHSVPCV